LEPINLIGWTSQFDPIKLIGWSILKNPDPGKSDFSSARTRENPLIEIQKSRSWKIGILDFLHPSQHPTEPPHCLAMIPPQVFAPVVKMPWVFRDSPPTRPPSIDDLKVEVIVALVLIPIFLKAIAVVLSGHGLKHPHRHNLTACPR
jgi:hypothetical protein